MSFKLSETSYLPVGRVGHLLSAQQVEALVGAEGKFGRGLFLTLTGLLGCLFESHFQR